MPVIVLGVVQGPDIGRFFCFHGEMFSVGRAKGDPQVTALEDFFLLRDLSLPKEPGLVFIWVRREGVFKAQACELDMLVERNQNGVREHYSCEQEIYVPVGQGDRISIGQTTLVVHLLWSEESGHREAAADRLIRHWLVNARRMAHRGEVKKAVRLLQNVAESAPERLDVREALIDYAALAREDELVVDQHFACAEIEFRTGKPESGRRRLENLLEICQGLSAPWVARVMPEIFARLREWSPAQDLTPAKSSESGPEIYFSTVGRVEIAAAEGSPSVIAGPLEVGSPDEVWSTAKLP